METATMILRASVRRIAEFDMRHRARGCRLFATVEWREIGDATQCGVRARIFGDMDSSPHQMPPQAARLAPKLRALADRGIYFGTSSWKYDGWVGSISREDRYLTRGKFSNAKFEQD
jgi:hypothetical protein